MQKHFWLQALIVALLVVGSTRTFAQATPTPGEVPASFVFTAIPHNSSDLSEINAGNLILTQGKEKADIANVVPLQGARAGLELYIMLDDDPALSYGSQIKDIRQFIQAQPPTTKVGVVYMNIEGPTVAQELTRDHSVAADAVRAPLARLANAQSPYTSLHQLIDRWPASQDRREILMVSNGEDQNFRDTNSGRNPYADAAISAAQRNGIVVFTIATANFDSHFADREPAQFSPPQSNFKNEGSGNAAFGTIYLQQIAEATGGEFYDYKTTGRLSFSPYLSDLTGRLASQYQLSFLAKPGKKPGLQSVKVQSRTPHVKVAAPDAIYIPVAAETP